MGSEPQVNHGDVESRLASLETAVARLSSIVEPAFAVSNMAAPVAAVTLKEAAQHEFSAKFFALLDVGETLLKYSAAIAFASGVQAGGEHLDDVRALFTVPPTLGKLADGLRRAVDGPLSSEWPIDLLRGTFRRGNGKASPVSRYLLEEFIRIRNDERGHGAQQPEGYYEGLYLKNHLIVQDCVRASKHISLPLLHIHAVDHDKGLYAYRTTLLMGGAPARMPEAIVTPSKVRVGSTCLWDRGTRLLQLDDFVTYRYCAVCALEHVFFAERITDQKVFLHSYFGNHRLVIERT